MSSIQKNIAGKQLKAKEGLVVGIVQSSYNPKITDALLETCKKTLLDSNISAENIKVMKVPGAFEIPFVCQRLYETESPDVIIALGAIIKGETPHFDFIANACGQGIMNLSLKLNIPIIFGILTTNTLAQAEARKDKGIEAALSALEISAIM